MMNENKNKTLTVHDFNLICRVCLGIGENMIDIYKSGIENQVMEVTNLEIKLDDKLPKTLCYKCNNQLNEFLSFIQQAKSSDTYLRSLLVDSMSVSPDKAVQTSEDKIEKKKTSCKKSLKKLKSKSRVLKKIRSDSQTDKMYLIYVPNSDNNSAVEDNQICIQDLNTESQNSGLTNYCKTLVKSHFLDHTYPREHRDYTELKDDEIQNLTYQSDCILDLNTQETKIFTVNVYIYKCSKCKEAFEEVEDLSKHFSTHNMELPPSEFNFSCPVCSFSVEEKSNFIVHLQAHKKEGFLFMKVNGIGEVMPANENEKDLFIESITKQSKYCKVFCVNLSSLNCTMCKTVIQSKDIIVDHLNSCQSSKGPDIKFSIRYICPVCHKTFFNAENNFIEHLGSHKQESCFFIKVKGTGEPAELEETDELFVPYDEAVKFLIEKGAVFGIHDPNICSKCNYKSDSFEQLCEHYALAHSQKFSAEVIFSCPVCSKKYSSESADYGQKQFYDHLMIHKNEGISFLLVNKNGEMVELGGKYSNLFSQSMFLWSVMNYSTLIFETCSPDLIVLDFNPPMKYTCDICKERFQRKKALVTHLNSHLPKLSVQNNVHYICEKCGEECTGKVNYRNHFAKHLKNLSMGPKKPVCAICNKIFASKATLNGHMRHHIKEGEGEESAASLFGKICEKCGKNFSTNASLTQHKKIHQREKESNALKCEICNRDFFRETAFNRHRSAHLNPKYFECHICKLPLPSVFSLHKHLEIHKNGSNTFDCKSCNLSFLTKDSLTAHETHTGHIEYRQPLECNVCNEKFFIGRKFTEHIKTHPKYKMGECSLCGKRLSTIQSLMLHIGRHFESNSILCPHCGKQFFEERNYHRHLLSHEGIKPFSCDTEGCKKSFYTLFELNRHKKYHNNTRDFRCPYCSKSFHEANHLTVHIRTHTGERPYVCPHCNRGFVTRTHCKQHIKLMHEGVGYDLIKSNISKKVTVFKAIKTLV